ncbi:response regulator [Flammeovirga yaeyamensis]|uniref:Response regulator n=1 Tax=Flammeovirga yaeyamensis TaxID=367791 RepID=A0AAX1MZD6_9BACT|nr:LytTR family DNA-binding domain-containing protein [Flammeovirga yaeyamensis]MBB3700849.1 DNA-binding LytR/AlgR family response regulator [Flammeovirga yaeyamensis]NMF37957.1 response regulator transcription factor [Flammeovirga yaeyamensis]QWG00609.1 response regulator [Flammeovirga yaeyamensis]
MKTIKTIIVDDEHLARSLIKDYVSKVPQLELLSEFKNAIDALTFIQTNEVDLIFLDIQMPNLTGIEFVESIQLNNTLVIFTTAYSEYALKGYELNAFDYLLKPITFPRFLQSVNKVIKQFDLIQSKTSDEDQALEQQSKNIDQVVPKKDSISIKADYKLHLIKYNHLRYLEGQKEYVAFHTTNKNILALVSLKKLESELPDDQFIRIHKSYIVNKSEIESLEGNMLSLGDVELPVGQSYRNQLLKLFE